MAAQAHLDALSVTGNGAEFLAAQYFCERGYRIVERNYKTARGELDLVVEKGDELAFVEVRYRKSKKFGAPEETVTRAKRRKISLAALEFVHRTGSEEKGLRFDVLALSPQGKGKGIDLAHIESAFEPDFSGTALTWN